MSERILYAHASSRRSQTTRWLFRIQKVLHDPYRCTSLQDLWASDHLYDYINRSSHFHGREWPLAGCGSHCNRHSNFETLEGLLKAHQFWLSKFIMAVIGLPRVTVVLCLRWPWRGHRNVSQSFMKLLIVLLWALNYTICTTRLKKTRTESMTRTWKNTSPVGHRRAGKNISSDWTEKRRFIS